MDVRRLPRPVDHRDLVIEALADGESQQVAVAASYRDLAHAAVAQLSAVTRQLAALREQHRQVVDEYRTFRARVMAPSSSSRAA